MANFASARCARAAASSAFPSLQSQRNFASARCARAAAPRLAFIKYMRGLCLSTLRAGCSQITLPFPCHLLTLPQHVARGLQLQARNNNHSDHRFASARCARAAAQLDGRGLHLLRLCLSTLRAGCSLLRSSAAIWTSSLPQHVARGLQPVVSALASFQFPLCLSTLRAGCSASETAVIRLVTGFASARCARAAAKNYIYSKGRDGLCLSTLRAGCSGKLIQL